MADKYPPLSAFLQKMKQEPDDEESEVEIKFLQGKRGLKGDPGKDSDPEEVAAMVLIPVSEILKDDEEFKQSIKGNPGKDGVGRPGKDAVINTALIIDEVLSHIPEQKSVEDLQGKPGKDGSPDTPKEIIEKINKSRGEKIKASKVEGFDELDGLARSANRNVQNFISLGGSRQTRIGANGTVYTGVNQIDFLNGTVAVLGDGTEITYTAPSGGGSSGFQQKTSGTIDGSNLVFAFASAPSAISVDQGRIMQKVSTDGTVNWTGTTTITLSVAPTFDIFGVA